MVISTTTVTGAVAGDRRVDPRDGLRVLLREHLHQRPEPLFVCGESVIPAASLWTGARRWVEPLRAAGIGGGDTVAVLLAPGTAFVHALVACWWVGATVHLGGAGPRCSCPTPPRLTVADRPVAGVATWRPHAVDGPAHPLATPACGTARTPATIDGPDLAIVTCTPRHRRVLTTAELLDRLTDPFLDVPPGGTCTAATAWTHADGLLHGLLEPLLGGAGVVAVDPWAGRDRAAVAALVARWPGDRFVVEPSTAS